MEDLLFAIFCFFFTVLLVLIIFSPSTGNEPCSYFVQHNYSIKNTPVRCLAELSK